LLFFHSQHEIRINKFFQPIVTSWTILYHALGSPGLFAPTGSFFTYGFLCILDTLFFFGLLAGADTLKGYGVLADLDPLETPGFLTHTDPLAARGFLL
jgi:hypothetical protein